MRDAYNPRCCRVDRATIGCRCAPTLVEHLDEGIGRVLSVLRNTGLDKNTLVVYSADNGGSLPHAQNIDPWRDGKQSHYDGGLRVPFSVRWPVHVASGSTCDYAGLSFDLFPTFLELAGAKPAEDIDARSLVRAMQGQPLGTLQLKRRPA